MLIFIEEIKQLLVANKRNNIPSSNEINAKIHDKLLNDYLIRSELRNKYREAQNDTGNAMLYLEKTLAFLAAQKAEIDELQKLLAEERKLSQQSVHHCSTMNVRFEGSLDSIRELEDLFEAEYFILDKTCQFMPYLKAKVAPEINHLKQMHTSKLSLLVVLRNADFVKKFTRSQLQNIACDNKSSFVRLLIGKEVLERADSDISYIEFATQLLLEAQDISNSPNDFETLKIFSDNTNALAQNISEFVQKKGDEVIKCDRVKAKIENHLNTCKNSPCNKPWELGWGGSRYYIEFESKQYNVPQGIAELYHLVKNPKENFEQLKRLAHEKSASPNSFYSFFRKLTGNGRADSTQETYRQLEEIIATKY